MAKMAQSPVRNVRHTRAATEAGSVLKIRDHLINAEKWMVVEEPHNTLTTKRGGRPYKRPSPARSNLTAATILRATACCCEHCGRTDNDPECGIQFYRAFRKACTDENSIEVRGPGRTGYGVFLKPGIRVKKGQLMGEYIGELIPSTTQGIDDHLYVFDVPNICLIDAERAGNWTRFINSHCEPNVSAWAVLLGKRHEIMFQARRDIAPGEELTFHYGGGYFAQAGLLCTCDAWPEAHVPRLVAKEEQTRKSMKKNQTAKSC